MTAYHRRVLERYRVLRRTEASWGQFLKLHGPQWLWVVGANAVLGLLSDTARPLLIGMSVGFILRDLSFIRSTRQFWPVFTAIVDWAKVDAALSSEDAG